MQKGSNDDFIYSMLYKTCMLLKPGPSVYDTSDLNAKVKTLFGFHGSIQFSNSGNTTGLLHSWLSCLLELVFVFVQGLISHCGLILAQVVASMFLPSVLICLSVCRSFSKRLISPLQSPSAVQFLNKGFLTRGWKEEDLASGATLQNLSIYQICVQYILESVHIHGRYCHLWSPKCNTECVPFMQCFNSHIRLQLTKWTKQNTESPRHQFW